MDPNKDARIRTAGLVFTPTAPIDEKYLFSGRHEQIRLVVDTINQKGQHAILFGERGVGKTSLANVLRTFFSVPNVLAPRINCEARDTFASLFTKAFDEIRLVSQRIGAGFTAVVEKEIVSANQIFNGECTADSVRKALSILGESNLVILIFDEFDRLDQDTKHSMADAIKSLSDHSVKTTILLVGVADSVSELIVEHASVERALRQIRMPRMSRNEIEEIITKGLRRLEIEIEVSAKESVVELSQGLPHYTHLLSLDASRNAIGRDSEKIESIDIEYAISRALHNAQHSIQSAYHLAVMSPRKDNLFADVLLSCALAPVDELGYFAAQDVRDPMRRITGKEYEIPSFSQHLNEFTEEKRGPIFQKIGTSRRYRFRFINPLMQPYVIMKGRADKKI